MCKIKYICMCKYITLCRERSLDQSYEDVIGGGVVKSCVTTRGCIDEKRCFLRLHCRFFRLYYTFSIRHVYSVIKPVLCVTFWYFKPRDTEIAWYVSNLFSSYLSLAPQLRPLSFHQNVSPFLGFKVPVNIKMKETDFYILQVSIFWRITYFLQVIERPI